MPPASRDFELPSVTCPDGNEVKKSFSCSTLVKSPQPVLNATLESCVISRLPYSSEEEYVVSFTIKNVGRISTRVPAYILIHSRRDLGWSMRPANLEKPFGSGEYLEFGEEKQIKLHLKKDDVRIYLFYVETKGPIEEADLFSHGLLLYYFDLRHLNCVRETP
ncbi:MAG: hypothetical protein QW343_03310 [Candidatus Norongarragalinales archaeon]